MVFDPTQHRWEELCRYDLTHEPRTDWTTPWVGDVLFIGDDASTARTIHNQLAKAYNHFYEDESSQMPAMPSTDPPAISDRHPSCSCQSSISDDNVMQISFENVPSTRAMCSRCLRFHGVYEGDEITDRETLFDEEWLFARSSERLVDRIINTADDDQYYLTSPGTTETRLETIVAAMCYMAFHDTATAVHFDPERHHAF